LYNRRKREKYRNDKSYRDKVIAGVKQYLDNNKEKVKKYRDKHYNDNRDRLLEEKREYWQRNRIEITEKRRQLRRQNPEKFRSYLRNSRKVNKDKWSEYDKKHYEKIKHFKVKQDTRFVKEALEQCNCTCVYCGSRDKIQTDHIIPMLKGGKHKLDNLVACCGFCNKSKGGTDDVIGWCLRMKRSVPDLVWEKLVAQQEGS
jgi:5-methylcytosine-specific restriction endonuclease McrA